MSKRYRSLPEGIKDGDTLDNAVNFIKNSAACKFDESVDMYIVTNLDTRQADQQIKGSILMPNGLGKVIKIAVFAKPEKAIEAEKAGADFFELEKLMENVSAKNIEFDRCIATPDIMGKIGFLGKILGPKGLMPNPKSGTVTFDIEKTVTNMKKGQVIFKADKSGSIYNSIGKVSFDADKIKENMLTFVQHIKTLKPVGFKGVYLKNIFISSTMGKAYKVNLSEFN